MDIERASPTGKRPRQRARATAPLGTQAIQRAAGILHEIALHRREGLREVDLVMRTGIKQPTVHRILKCLLAEGMVMQDPGTRGYLLGQRIFEFGLAAASHFNLRDYCQAALARLAADTKDTVFLIVKSGFESVVVDRKEGTFPIRTMPLEIGDRRPLGMGAASQALLMALSDAEIAEVIQANDEVLRGEHGVNPDALRRKLTRSRRRGYAVTKGYGYPGITGVGVPIRNAWGAPLAAISVTATAPRMTDSHIKTVYLALQKEVLQLQTLIRNRHSP
jgi:DNA-binding IclR family transcriptional regulator